MSDFMWADCACGVRIVSITGCDEDRLLAVTTHNETVKHTEWRVVQEMKKPTRRGPCICKGGEAGPLRFRRKASVAS